MSGKKSQFPDGRIPDRLPDGRPAVPESRGLKVFFPYG